MIYPAKILLFGEYGILLNSMALSIPFAHFSGSWANLTETQWSSDALNSNNILKQWATYLKDRKNIINFIDQDRLEKEIESGLYFKSTIPNGSGLGSSGALTAALYERFVTDSNQLENGKLKERLGWLESYFHGESSGFDPLSSLLRKTLLFNQNRELDESINLSAFWEQYTLFLIKSNKKGETDNYVEQFKKEYRLAPFREKIDHAYLPLINQTVLAVIESDFDKFEESIRALCLFQRSSFKQLITKEIAPLIDHGLNDGSLYVKVCGSGGGGYFLGFSSEPEKAESLLKQQSLEYMIVKKMED